jgi:hypothetical protein
MSCKAFSPDWIALQTQSKQYSRFTMVAAIIAPKIGAAFFVQRFDLHSVTHSLSEALFGPCSSKQRLENCYTNSQPHVVGVDRRLGSVPSM